MVIRKATEGDLDTCGEIYAAAFSTAPYCEQWTPGAATDMLSGLLSRDPDHCWCAELDGRIVGFVFCTVFGTFRATVQEFAIAPAYQHKGLGTKMMEHVLDELRSAGLQTVDLVVHRKAPAYRMYKRFGFRQPDDYVLMVRWL